MSLVDLIKRCNGLKKNNSNTIFNIVNEKIQSEIKKLQINMPNGETKLPIGPRLKMGIITSEQAQIEIEQHK